MRGTVWGGLGLAFTLVTPAFAEEGYGNLVRVTAVTFLPDEAAPTAVHIEGVFVTKGGVPTRGVVDLRCPQGREVDCRTQWSMISVGQCFVFATESAPVAVRSAPLPATGPLPPWPVDGWAGRVDAAAASCVAARGPAEPPRPSSPPPMTRERRWYGWQTLTVDAAIVAGTVGMALLNKRFGSGFESGWLVVLPAVVGAYGAVVPILHGAHGRGDLAGASISWRLGLPVLGAMLGGEKVGIGGLFLAMALDASLAFWDAPKAGSPVVSITRDGVALGFRQTF